MTCIDDTLLRITYQKHTLESMSAMWLLPIVTLIVAASSGGVVASAIHQYSATYALNTVIVSVFLVTVGLSLALMVLTIYLLRLILHGLPPGPSLLSVFLPLGPTGQSGWGTLLIGQNLQSLFPPLTDNNQLIRLSDDSAGRVVNVICTCLAFVLWSMATMWILYAFLAIYTGLRKRSITFRASFWGLVFPNVCSFLLLTENLADFRLLHRLCTQISPSNYQTPLIQGVCGFGGLSMPLGRSSFGS